MNVSGSESDDDCYGNVAKKLQSLKNNFRETEKSSNNMRLQHPLSVPLRKDCWSPITVQAENNFTDDNSTLDELLAASSLPPVNISTTSTATAKSPKKRVTRRSARLSKSNSEPTPTSMSQRGRKSVAPTLPVDPPSDAALAAAIAALPAIPGPSRRGRNRKSDALSPALVPPAPPVPAPPAALSHPAAPSPSAAPPRRGRGSRVGRGGRGRGGSRARRSRGSRQCVDDSAIVYSVGNTHEYPDMVENVPLFSQKNTTVADPDLSIVEVADLSSSFTEDNEELSVKVYWQQMEFVKFNIRRFQKLAQIFKFFSERELVSSDKLLFTLRGRILHPNDTPDSVQYNVGLFIDGGVVNHSIASLGSSGNDKENKVSSSSITLKFQCQNAKRPFETRVELDEKLSLAMVKCAEHFELPYDRVRFLLDGDPLGGGETAAGSGLDDGDCIDVKLLQ